MFPDEEHAAWVQRTFPRPAGGEPAFYNAENWAGSHHERSIVLLTEESPYKGYRLDGAACLGYESGQEAYEERLRIGWPSLDRVSRGRRTAPAPTQDEVGYLPGWFLGKGWRFTRREW